MTQTRGFASTLIGITCALGTALVSETTARQPGLLQSIDPRTCLLGLSALILAVTLAHKIAVVAAIFVAAIFLGLASHVAITTLALRVWLPVLLFTGVIASPALFITPGTPVLGTPFGTLHITSQGLWSATLLIVRVETAATLATLLVLTTPWMGILRALRFWRVPSEVVMMLAMTHRYIFLLAETASQMLESRESRTVGVLDQSTQRRVVGQTAGVLLGKSMELGNGVYLAMQSRGFRGDAPVLTDSHMRRRDYLMLTVFLASGAVAVWIGRA